MKKGLNPTDEITAELGAQIAALQQALSERSRAIVQLDVEIHKLQQTVAQQRQEFEQHKQFIVDTFENSLSWRLTRPVRIVGTTYRKLKARLFQSRPADAVEKRPSPSGRGRPEGPSEGAGVTRATPGEDEILKRAVEEILDRGRMPATFDGYVHRVTDRIDPTKLEIKAVAFYSPKFYPLEASEDEDPDEWCKVVRAAPRYLGHYQPNFPGELGLYDLRVADVLRKQAELARQYGISGFCFHHYWYAGKARFGLPLQQLLTDPGLNMPFCICWSNGASRERWDQEASRIPEGSRDPTREDAFVESIWPALSDPRYIRIDGKPLLIVLAAHFLLDAPRTAQRWRERAEELGCPGLYLAAAQSFDLAKVGLKSPRDIGFDAIVEYPPFQTDLADLTSKAAVIDAKFAGRIRSYPELVEKQIRVAEPSFAAFKTVMVGWDDEPQKPGAGQSFTAATPPLYGKWLKRACEVARSRPASERLVFINAWNDWTNGAHLEPDRRFGYAHLHVTANVLRHYYCDSETEQLVQQTNAAFKRTSEVAIILHCFYEDLIAPVFDRYLASAQNADLFVTTRRDVSKDGIEEILRYRPNVFIQVEENLGRDIRPFLLALRRIQALGYKFACKIHTKKTSHLAAGLGGLWRQKLMEPLLGSADSVARALTMFEKESDLGILAPEGSVMDLSRTKTNMFNTIWLDRLLKRLGRPDLIGNYAFPFPAGSMFWFRVAALGGLDDFILQQYEFEPECGQTDGTLAHAVERLVAVFAEQRGYRMREIKSASL